MILKMTSEMITNIMSKIIKLSSKTICQDADKNANIDVIKDADKDDITDVIKDDVKS